MLLLDLPPETFQRIIANYIAIVGLCTAWKHREVCSRLLVSQNRLGILTVAETFNSYITDEVLGRQPKQRYSRGSNLKLVLNGIHIYLNLRSKSLYGAHDYMPGVVCKAVACFMNAKNETSNTARDRYTKKVTVAIKKYSVKLRLLAIHPRAWSLKAAAKDSDDTLALCIAAGIGDRKLARAVLDRCDDLWKPTYCFGYPLQVALRTGNLVIIRLFLQKHTSTSEQISAALAPIITDNEFAIPGISEGGLKILVEWYFKAFGRPKDSICTQLMRWARAMDSLELAQYILHMGASSRLSSLYGLNYMKYPEGCSAGLFGLFLKENILNTEKVYTHVAKYSSEPLNQSLLAFSVQRGDAVAVKAILKAGANPDGVIFEGRLEYPIIRAIETLNIPVVELLLNYGADPEAGVFPYDGITVDHMFGEGRIYRLIRQALNAKMQRLGDSYVSPLYRRLQLLSRSK